MDSNQINETLLESMSIIAQSEMAKVSYDKTITCTIIDDSLRAEGKYIVTDGSAKFSAYSDNTTYKNKMVVYVSIPNGDFSEQKMILGKKTDTSIEPFKYQSPFDSFLPCTPNIIPEINRNNKGKGFSLQANAAGWSEDIDEPGNPTGCAILTKEDIAKYYKDFNRLGIKADFKTWLGNNVSSGDYGLVLKIGHKEKSSEYQLGGDGYNSFLNYYIKTQEGEYVLAQPEEKLLVNNVTVKNNKFYHNGVEVVNYKLTYYTLDSSGNPIGEVVVDPTDIWYIDNETLILHIVLPDGNEDIYPLWEIYELFLEDFASKEYYFLNNEGQYQLVSETGFQEDTQYYVISKKPVNITADNYYNFKDDELYAINKNGKQISVKPQTEKNISLSNIDKNKKFFIKTYNRTDSLTKDNYVPNKYYYTNISALDAEKMYWEIDKGIFQKVSSSNIDPSKSYKILDFEEISSNTQYEPNKYYYLSEDNLYILENGFDKEAVYCEREEKKLPYLAKFNLLKLNNLYEYNSQAKIYQKINSNTQSINKKNVYNITWAQNGKTPENKNNFQPCYIKRGDSFVRCKIYPGPNMPIYQKETDEYYGDYLSDISNTLEFDQKNIQANANVIQRYNKVSLNISSYEPNKYFIVKNNAGNISVELATSIGDNNKMLYCKKEKSIDNNGNVSLSTDNGFDSSKKYYEKKYEKINIAKKPNFPIYYYNSIEKKYVEETEKILGSTKTYYKEIYKYIILTYETYQPNIYYYKDDNNQYKFADDNGFNLSSTYYELDFAEVNNNNLYENNKYYIKDNGSYQLFTYSGFDASYSYYYNDDKVEYIPVSISKEDYVANKFYYQPKEEIYDYLIFNTQDMIGSPYQFTSYFNQEKVFDISSFKDITSMNLYFYQDNKFYDKDKEFLSYKNNNVNSIDNLFVTNIELYFGYAAENIEDEYLQLFTYDDLRYKATTKPIENMKNIYLKWVHKDDDKTYMLDKDNIDVFLQEQIDEISKEDTLRPSVEDNYVMKLDGSLEALENRVYYNRIVKPGNSKGNCNINFIFNGSEEFSKERQYYKRGYYLKDSEEEIIYSNDTMYQRTLKKVVDNAEYDQDIKYYVLKTAFVKVIDDATGDIIDREISSYVEVPVANKDELHKEGSSYYQESFEENQNGEYRFGYKLIANKDISKEYLYNCYYADYVFVKEDGAYEITYEQINGTDFNYEPNKYYYIYINDNKPFEIRWYRYVLGAPSADEYSGVYWQKIAATEEGGEAEFMAVNSQTFAHSTHLLNDFVCELHPDYIYNKTEKIKAIVIYNNQIYYSNIIEFTNDSEVINIPNQEQENALRITYTDSSLGNYYLYGEDNYLIDNGQANKNRSIKLLFDLKDYSSSSLLKDASKVTWIFPIEDTMLKVLPSYTNGTYSENGQYGYIVDTTGREVYELFYNIDRYYGFNKNNNTIICNIEKDGVMYSTTAEFSFGQAGSNGTEYTLVLDIQNQDHVITLYPTGLGEKSNLYYLGYVKEDADNIDFSKNTKYYIQNVNETEEAVSYEYEIFNIDDYKTVKPQLYKEGFIQITETEYKKLTLANTKFFRKISDNEYIQVENTIPAESNKVIATLYDQNHQKINIDNYTIAWSWLTDQQQLFTIEEQDNHSIHLIINNNVAYPENEICILKATLIGFGDYELISYLPIPIRNTFEATRFQGPTKIIYSTTGAPNYYKDEIHLYYNDENGNQLSYPVNKENLKIYPNQDYAPELIFSNLETGEYKCRIEPISAYIDGVLPFGIQCYYEGKWLWTQPILNIQNKYFSSTINKWDGKINVDKENNTILSKMMGAGSKDEKNQFSGVVLGDWTGNVNQNDSVNSIAGKTGLFGFHQGATSFGFMEDGTGFIGKSGKGRILFDGNESTITSSAWDINKTGMYLDIDDGFLLLQNSSGGYIKLNSLASNSDSNPSVPSKIPLPGKKGDSSFPFVVRGSDDNYTGIGWDGNLKLSSKKGTDGSIILDASASEWPLQIGDEAFNVAWDGSLYIGGTSDSSANLIADSKGILTAISGKFKGCSSNSFTLKEFKTDNNTPDTAGIMGIVEGFDGEKETGNIGISSQGNYGLKLFSSKDMSITADGGVYVSGSKINLNADYTKKNMDSILTFGVNKYGEFKGITINSENDEIKINCSIAAKHQTGFYARFA